MKVEISQGTPDDYRALAHLHYRAGKPATIVRVLCAHVSGLPLQPGQRELVGVLVVSMPVLNDSWRARAWPALGRRLANTDARGRATLLNSRAGVRTLSRAIV